MSYCGKCGRWLDTGEICSCDNTEENEQTTAQIIPENKEYDPTLDPYIMRYQDPKDVYGNGNKDDRSLKIVAVFVVICIAVVIASFVIIPTYYINNVKKENRKRDSIAIDADSLKEASDTALDALYEQDITLKGMYFISSDKESNVAVPFDAELFYDELERNLPVRKAEAEYFIIVRNGKTEYAATSYTWLRGKLDTYPSKNDEALYFTFEDEPDTVTNRTNLDMLYWNAYDQIFKEE